MKKTDIKYIIYALLMLAGMAVLLVLVGGNEDDGQRTNKNPPAGASGLKGHYKTN